MSKRTFLILFLLILPVLAGARPIELKVRGVGIGTPYPIVIKTFGKPLSKIKRGLYPCDSGPIVTLRYPGMIIRLIISNNRRYYSVASIEVTSAKWSVAGISVGSNLETVRKKLAQERGSLLSIEGRDCLPYLNPDGYASFCFRKNKLNRIAWELNPC